MTEFTAAQIAEIADRYAIAKSVADEANARLTELKKLVDETGMAELVGETFRLDVNIFDRATFDGATAKTFLTPEQVKTCTKVSMVRTIKIKSAAKLQSSCEHSQNASKLQLQIVA